MSIHDELQNFWETYAAAYRVGDATACAAMFALDGELYSPYAPPACGRAAIEALHRIWTEGAGTDKRLTVLKAGSSGDLAWCLAAYSEGQATGDGTSLDVFERRADGKWLIRMCSLNSNDPHTED
ncbi:nuclear transport factor 2 family protein [Mesorhizobium sp. M0244]|uniref:YybH family protein n=1 Tax=Mesorhizobium sp. M0244 TaxID=2956926 RepID=UPI00333DD237